MWLLHNGKNIIFYVFIDFSAYSLDYQMRTRLFCLCLQLILSLTIFKSLKNAQNKQNRYVKAHSNEFSIYLFFFSFYIENSRKGFEYFFLIALV